MFFDTRDVCTDDLTQRDHINSRFIFFWHTEQNL